MDSTVYPAIKLSKSFEKIAFILKAMKDKMLGDL